MKQLFKTSAIYFIGQICSKLIWFLLLPLYTNFISVTDYGFYDLVISILNVVIPVVFIEIWSGSLRFTLETQDTNEKRIILNNCIIISFISLAIFSIMFILTYIITPFDSPAIIYIYSLVWVMQLIALSVTRAYGHNILYAISGIISVIVNFVISVISIKIFGGSLEVMFYGMISSYIVQIMLVEFKLKIIRNFHITDIDRNLIKELFLFCFPLSFNSIVHWLLEGFNKIIINAKLGIAINGIYAVANKFSVVINLFVSVFLLAWQEVIFKITDINEKEYYYNYVTNMFIKALGAVVILIIPIIQLAFPYIIGDDYASAFGLIPILILSIYINSINGVFSTLFSSEKKTKYLLYCKITMALINVLTMLYFVNIIGSYASPISLCISYLIGMAMEVCIVKKIITFKLEIGNLISFSIMYIISTFIYTSNNNLLSIIFFISATIIYLFIFKDFLITLKNNIANKKLNK